MKQTEWRTLASAICPDGSITDTHGLIELVTEMRYFFDRMDEGIEEREQLKVEVGRLRNELNEWVKTGAKIIDYVENMEKIIREIKGIQCT